MRQPDQLDFFSSSSVDLPYRFLATGTNFLSLSRPRLDCKLRGEAKITLSRVHTANVTGSNCAKIDRYRSKTLLKRSLIGSALSLLTCLSACHAASRLQVLTHLPKEMERKNQYELRAFVESELRSSQSAGLSQVATYVLLCWEVLNNNFTWNIVCLSLCRVL